MNTHTLNPLLLWKANFIQVFLNLVFVRIKTPGNVIRLVVVDTGTNKRIKRVLKPQTLRNTGTVIFIKSLAAV